MNLFKNLMAAPGIQSDGYVPLEWMEKFMVYSLALLQIWAFTLEFMA
jgi:hypothetical protein